ncbi:MAG: T9SS type A sorting domain-containing protein [Bacteroidota bacterium]
MKTILFILLFSFSLNAQERVLLHINRNGQQEAIPLKKGERAQDVIARIENEKSHLLNSKKPNGLIDTLKYYPNEASLTTNFGFIHQDIALQWYTPAAGGIIKEFWWRNYEKGGTVRKATIRAWKVDPKVATRPSSVLTKHLGYYKDPNDGDGHVTPFKPENGDQWFYSNGGTDSSTWRFDPLGTEASGFKNGLQVFLDSNQWQGIAFEDYGDTIVVSLGELFGFTISNETKKNDILIETDERMEILSWTNLNPAPYHSYKWYENGRSAPGVDNGWHLRGDYEWGMYVVIDYCTDRPPRFFVNPVSTTFGTFPVKVTATIDGWGGCGIPYESVDYTTLFYRKGSGGIFDSTLMIRESFPNYVGTIPGFDYGDTIFFKVIATGNRSTRKSSPLYQYRIFKRYNDRLFVHNNAQYFLKTGALIYTSSPSKYDQWSAPRDGTKELSTLYALYDNILIADGGFPARDVYTKLKEWIGTGSSTTKKTLFFTSQDYGCYIQPACGDTTFPIGAFEEKYLGIKKLGPQDQGPTNRPIKITPQSDTVTNYIIKYNADSATTLWYYPSFELGFASYPDFMTPTASAKPVFKDASGQNVYGIRNAGTNFNTMFFALDVGSLQFRSDTSLHNSDYSKITDPKYRLLGDVNSLVNVFMDAVTDVKIDEAKLPAAYSLQQNYPNPFNPSTTIEYNIPVKSSVNISIYNTLGQNVATIVNETKEAGSHSATFNAQSLASGVYFYKMYSGNFMNVKKMLLMK